jgi:hypothetical protein
MPVKSIFLICIFSLIIVLDTNAQDCPRPDTVYVLYAGTESELYELHGLNNESPRSLHIDEKHDAYYLSHKGATEVFKSVSTERFDIAESDLVDLHLFSVHDLYLEALEIRKCVFAAAEKSGAVYPSDNNLWYWDNIFLIIYEHEKLVARKVTWWTVD